MSTEKGTDEALLRGAIRGDEESFQTLYLRYREPLYRSAYALLGSSAPAEDAVHDCFLAALEAGSRFSPERGSVRAYLFGIVRHLSLRQLRHVSKETGLSSNQPALQSNSSSSEPLASLIREERQQLVQSAMLNLTGSQREVLNLAEWEQLSLAAVAIKVGADIGVVKSRLHRARERLRRFLTAKLAVQQETNNDHTGSAQPE